jgi:RNA-binding protein YlmH
MYLVEKTINKLNSYGHTFFLKPNELDEVTRHLKKNSYEIYKPYPYSEKNIIYKSRFPEVVLFEIITPTDLRHQDIMGSLYSLQIEDNLFGDIVIRDGHYYVYVLETYRFYFESELKKISNVNIKLNEVPLSTLDDYVPNFEYLKVITSSLRLDSVIARTIKTNRDTVKDLIKDKQVVYNYELLKSPDKLIKENDTFSVRKIGKFKFNRIITNTKKDNLILEILKYQ